MSPPPTDDGSIVAAVLDTPSRRLEVRAEPSIVHVAGDVDAATAEEFKDALRRCDADPLVHALDLRGVGFFSAAGVRCFAELDWPTQPHALIFASESVRRVLALCRMEFLLDAHGWLGSFDGWCAAIDESS